jgi:hypothetical protein
LEAGKNSREPVLPIPSWPREYKKSKQVNDLAGGYWRLFNIAHILTLC